MATVRMPDSVRAAVLPLVTAIGLSACATPVEVPPPPAGQWQGRFAVTLTQAPADTNAMQTEEDRAQGRFRLERTAQGRISLDLFSPFGQTMARAGTGPDGAWLALQDGRRLEAGDADTLLERALGWRLPVSALPDWLAGREPTDDDWLVRVERRFSNGAPRTLQADWPAQAGMGVRRLRLRIVVDGGTG
jgi:outer membrane lipoprotein LolB